jgi:hypothetical protein
VSETTETRNAANCREGCYTRTYGWTCSANRDREAGCPCAAYQTRKGLAVMQLHIAAVAHAADLRLDMRRVRKAIRVRRVTR